MRHHLDTQAIEAVLAFWLEEVGPNGWFRSDPALDARCKDHCGALAAEAAQGGLSAWQASPRGTLALLILLDQMPRNIHRDTPLAFASDPMARAVAKRATRLRWDLEVEGAVRNLFYLPLMHSESVADQDRCLRLCLTRLGERDADGRLKHPLDKHEAAALSSAIEHRDTILRFGRFPARNTVLGRTSSPAEEAFLATGARFVKHEPPGS
ncbi:MAG: DUF924 family protein [Pseudomonadota bacterium]